MNQRTIILLACLLALRCQCKGQTVPSPERRTASETHQMDMDRLAVIDEIVGEGLRRGRMPGCVVMVGRKSGVVFHKAYGDLQTEPSRVPMELDTVFDMASLTKPIATATSIMLLVEDGMIDLKAPVADYIPEFSANGKGKITIRQLLTHMGGLIPDNSIKDYADGRKKAFERIYSLKTYVDPGTRFVYTDVGYIVLAEVVRKVSGQSVDQFSHSRIFQPLGMDETGYLPSGRLKERCAVTEKRNQQWIRGEVHDPRAYLLEGIAGHAGLFSTAADLSRYCRMLLNKGTLEGVNVMKPKTMKRMTEGVRVSSGIRTLGWDMKSPYSSNRGDLFSPQAFGHGGFTGTSLWVDPTQDLFVIFLSNRVHPDGKGSVNSLAGRIGTVAAASIEKPSAP